MISRWSLLLIVAVACASSSAGADNALDGSKPLICSLDDAVDCTDRNDECNKGDAAAVQAPDLIRVDFKRKTVKAMGVSADEDDVAAIRHVETMDGRLVVQGAQNGRGWSMVVVGETGASTIAVAGNDHGFLIFGTCTPDT